MLQCIAFRYSALTSENHDAGEKRADMGRCCSIRLTPIGPRRSFRWVRIQVQVQVQVRVKVQSAEKHEAESADCVEQIEVAVAGSPIIDCRYRRSVRVQDSRSRSTQKDNAWSADRMKQAEGAVT
jgi:hypothetical protein